MYESVWVNPDLFVLVINFTSSKYQFNILWFVYYFWWVSTEIPEAGRMTFAINQLLEDKLRETGAHLLHQSKWVCWTRQEESHWHTATFYSAYEELPKCSFLGLYAKNTTWITKTNSYRAYCSCRKNKNKNRSQFAMTIDPGSENIFCCSQECRKRGHNVELTMDVQRPVIPIERT